MSVDSRRRVADAVKAVGIQSRDWYRNDPPKGPRLRRLWLIAIVVAILVGAALSPPVSERLGYTLPFGLDKVIHRGESGGTRIGLFPGAPSVAIRTTRLYPRDDPWKAWLADEQTCPGGENRAASPADQLQTMLCLINFARTKQGLQPLSVQPLLNQSAEAKAADIARCHDFAHEACGKDPRQVANDLGYTTGSFGENIYIAEGPMVAPRVALDRWLNSPGHRENLFRPYWKTTGIARQTNTTARSRRTGGTVDNGVLWVNQFGTR
jgi:uncharacterized protein YkwD